MHRFLRKSGDEELAADPSLAGGYNITQLALLCEAAAVLLRIQRDPTIAREAAEAAGLSHAALGILLELISDARPREAPRSD